MRSSSLPPYRPRLQRAPIRAYVGAPDGSHAQELTAADQPDRSHGRTQRWLGGLVMLMFITLPVASGIGPVAIAPAVVASIVGHHVVGWPEAVTWSAAQEAIVTQVRIPRVLLGAVVGAGLAVAGTALQAMVRNVLEDPYLLGVTSGASTGAAATILFGVGLGASSLTGSAFLGALGSMVAVFALARSGGQITSIRLLLAGVAVGYLLSATTSFLIYASDSEQGARNVLFWLLGSLSLATWPAVGITGTVVLVSTGMLLVWARRLDALAIGDDTARSLGISPSWVRGQLLMMVSLCVGAVVAVSGGIGFVGLVVPHIARLCVGGTHRRSLPAAALIGSLFLVWADALARVLLAPAEIPLGILTAIAGAPMLFVLVRRFHASQP